jgi:TonB-linked SusC/RagA family outer membrane protein
MKKLILSLFMIFGLYAIVLAQNRTITGTVTGKDDGLPLPGVSVRVKNSTIASQTNAKGTYSVSVPSGSVLVFSFIGYNIAEVPAGNRETINVSLEASSRTLNDVVITGALGIQRQKKEIGYAATAVNNATITAASAVNLANGLQGKVSGLNITTTNSGVFENVKINLRGIRSLTGNNNPLLLLDGVQADINFLSSLNPNDIEDVTVLKGSAGAALYGSDARNGVLVVTTKKGTKNGAPLITVSNSTQFQDISFFPKFQEKYGSGGGGTSAVGGEYTPYENWSWGPAFDGSTVEIGSPLPDGSVQTTTYSAKDDRKKFFNTGSIIQNDVSYADKDFYLSAQDAIIKGIVPDDKNRRTGIRLNASREYGKFKVGFSTNYIQQNYNVFDSEGMADYNASQNIGLNQGLMNLIFNTPAQIPLTQYKDFKNDKWSQFNNYYNAYGLNPYFAIDNWRKVGKRADLISNLDLNLKATDWLNFTYRAGITSQSIDERRTSQGETPSDFGIERGFNPLPGSVEERSYRSQRLSSELFASINKKINEDFKVNAVLGTYVRQDDLRDTRVGAVSLVVPELYNIGQRVGNLTGSSPSRRSRLFSYYGSVGLNYKGWANIEVTGRNDKTSVLGVNNNSFFYPGVSASLVITDAISSLKGNSVLSFLKLRGGWNKTGNADIAPYLLASTFSQGGGFPYGTLPGYSADNTIYDANLKPEFIKAFEAGFESGFFNNRLTIDATYFHQDNTNQIIPINISSATAYTSAYVNAASFANKGFELDLGLTPLVKLGDVRVNFKVNATYNDSNISSVYPGLDQVAIGGYTYASNYAIVDNPAFMIRATDYLRDSEGRVIVNATTGLPTADPNTKIFGNTLPKWIVGLNPSVRWKSLTVSALFEYKGGYSAYHDIGNAMAWTGVSEATGNRERFVIPNSSILVNGQYIPNTSVTVTNPESFYTGVYRATASNFITSATSWRFRELSVGYDLPLSVLGKQNVIKGLNFALTARNLVLWLPKSNVYTDPDFTFSPSSSSFGNGSSTGVTTGNQAGISNSSINPPTRTIGGNITIKF